MVAGRPHGRPDPGRPGWAGLAGEAFQLVGGDGVLGGVGGGQVARAGDVADELLDGQDGRRAAGRHHPVGQELALVLGEFGGVGGLGGGAVGNEGGGHRGGDVGGAVRADPVHGGDQRVDHLLHGGLVGGDPVGAGQHAGGRVGPAQPLLGAGGGGQVDHRGAGALLLDRADGGLGGHAAGDLVVL